MLGIELPINFMSPYKARSIIEFWQRWHITLSRFLKDYLYIPLGGNRTNRQMINIMITMLIGGMWHGANWAFLLWGAIHGAMIVCNHMWRRIVLKKYPQLIQIKVYSAICLILTLFLVFLAWVPFRVNDPQQFLAIWSKMLSVSDLLVLPYHYEGKLGSVATQLENIGFAFTSIEQFPIARIFLYCFLGFATALLFPNTS